MTTWWSQVWEERWKGVMGPGGTVLGGAGSEGKACCQTRVWLPQVYTCFCWAVYRQSWGKSLRDNWLGLFGCLITGSLQCATVLPQAGWLFCRGGILPLLCYDTRKGPWCFVTCRLMVLNRNSVYCADSPSRFSLANSVIFGVLHENSVFQLNIGIDKQILWSPTPISLLFLCIFPYQNSQPVKRGSLQSVCSSLVFLIFPRTLPNLYTVLSIF